MMAVRKVYFTRTDVARIGGEEAARMRGDDPATATPLKPATITAYVRDSQPGSGGRYEDNPIPLPVYDNDQARRRGQHPHWLPQDGETLTDLERSLRRWFATRRGRDWRATTAGTPTLPRLGTLLAELLAHPDQERNLTALAAAADIPRGTMRALVVRMVDRGWLTVRDGDGTEKLAKLTEQGRSEGPADLARMQAAVKAATELVAAADVAARRRRRRGAKRRQRQQDPT